MIDGTNLGCSTWHLETTFWTYPRVRGPNCAQVPRWPWNLQGPNSDASSLYGFLLADSIYTTYIHGTIDLQCYLFKWSSPHIYESRGTRALELTSVICKVVVWAEPWNLVGEYLLSKNSTKKAGSSLKIRLTSPASWGQFRIITVKLGTLSSFSGCKIKRRKLSLKPRSPAVRFVLSRNQSLISRCWRPFSASCDRIVIFSPQKGLLRAILRDSWVRATRVIMLTSKLSFRIEARRRGSIDFGRLWRASSLFISRMFFE